MMPFSFGPSAITFCSTWATQERNHLSVGVTFDHCVLGGIEVTAAIRTFSRILSGDDEEGFQELIR